MGRTPSLLAHAYRNAAAVLSNPVDGFCAQVCQRGLPRRFSDSARLDLSSARGES